MIPADLRILQARDLFVAQASLTGESLPVEKVARSRDPQQTTRWSATPCALWAPTW
jgi:Mg2+-importing ATPase